MTEDARVSELESLEPEDVQFDDIVYIARPLSDQFKQRVRDLRSSKNYRVVDSDDMLPSDEVLLVYSETAPVEQLTLPDPSEVNSKLFSIKNLQQSEITIVPASPADTDIDFESSLTIPGMGSVIIYCDGLNYFTIALDTGPKDLLSDLANSEVSITAATTLTSTAFGKMHVISGTTADYDVDLPAASGNAGKTIGVRIANDATRFFTIKGNGTEEIDGLNERVMWQSESAILLCDGSGWTKIAGKSRPLKVVARRNAAQTLSASSFATIVFDTIDTDSRSSSPIASLFFSTSTGLFTAPRPSQYGCSFFLGNADNTAYSMNITRNGTARLDDPNVADLMMFSTHAGEANGRMVTGFWGLNKDDTIRGYIFNVSSTSTPTTAGRKPTFTVTEIPEW